MVNDLKWYRHDMMHYYEFFKSPLPIKDKPITIYHIEPLENFLYLTNRYKVVMELDDTDNFIQETALYHLTNPEYKSTTVEFFGNDDMIESYFMKNGIMECFEFKIKFDKKVHY